MGTSICKNCGQEFISNSKSKKSNEFCRDINCKKDRSNKWHKKNYSKQGNFKLIVEPNEPMAGKGLNMSKRFNFEVGQKIRYEGKYATITAVYDVGIVITRKCKLGITDIKEFINMIAIRLNEVRVDVV
jgi:hypothetical protein